MNLARAQLLISTCAALLSSSGGCATKPTTSPPAQVFEANAPAVQLVARSAHGGCAGAYEDQLLRELEEANCRLAKRVISRSERRAAGLCPDDMSDEELSKLQHALEAVISPDIFNLPWDWRTPGHVEYCGVSTNPAARDLELYLKTASSADSAEQHHLSVSGYSDDGVSWHFDTVNYTNDSLSVDARLTEAERAGVVAFVNQSLPWISDLTEPKLNIAIRDTMNYQDFEGVPLKVRYSVRIYHHEDPDRCASATLLLESPPSVYRVNATPPHKCPEPVICR